MPLTQSLAGGLAFLLCGAALAVFSAVVPVQSRDAEAQTDPATITAIQTPPPVPGIDYDAAVTEAAPVASPAAGTEGVAPAPADVATGEATLTEDNGGYSTSLGGSDVAVASVGESHQVDGPKRRMNRLPIPQPRP